MGYELYQSRHKGYEIDNLLDDVKDIKPKVAALEQGYDANKVKMADGTVLPAFLVTNMASKNDIADMATNTSVAKDIQDATKNLVDGDTVDTKIAAATAGFVDGNTVDTKIAAATTDMATNASVATDIQNATKDLVTESDVEDIISDDFTNKSTLDDLSTSDDGNLLFKGQEIKGGGRPEDGMFIDPDDVDILNGGELIGDASKFTKQGEHSLQLIINNNQIIIYSHYEKTWTQAAYNEPIINKGQKITITKTLSAASPKCAFYGYCLGTSIGASDIAKIPGDISSINAVDIIDLSQYQNKTIYFSVRLEVVFNDNLYCTITSIMDGETIKIVGALDFKGNKVAPKTILDYLKDSFGNPVEFSNLEDNDVMTFEDGKWINKPVETGSDVEANPEGTATAELKKLRVGNGIFSIPEGGSGGVGGDLYFGYEDYSEEEKVIGRWTDGKPVYRKVFKFNNTSTITIGDGTYYNTGFIIKNTIPINAFIVTPTSLGVTFPVGVHTHVTDDLDGYVHIMSFRKDANYISAGGACLVYIYRKSTDAENSFKPSMMTNNALLPVAPSYDDYSEDEIVVGKWIDGRPVYRKYFILQITETSSGLHVIPDTFTDNLDIVINETCWLIYEDGSSLTLNTTPWYTSAGLINNGYNKTHKGFQIWSAGDAHGTPIRIVLDYVKTTDKPNSFTPDMIKTIPLVDDVTEEEVNVAIDILKEAK